MVARTFAVAGAMICVLLGDVTTSHAEQIVEYNAVLSNPALVALARTKHLSADLLMTYLVAPGTALYVGYTDGYDNVTLEPLSGTRLIRSPSTSTGRQFFVRTSYLFRF